MKPELGRLSAQLAAGGAIEGIAEGFIQNAQIPDLHRSAGSCHEECLKPVDLPGGGVPSRIIQ
jgi:hypothetical protein